MTKYSDDEDYVMVRLKTGKFKRYNWTRGQGVWVSKINTEEERQILAAMISPLNIVPDIDGAMRYANEHFKKTGKPILVTPGWLEVNLRDPDLDVALVHRTFSAVLGANRVESSKRWSSAA